MAQLQEALLHCGKFQDALEPLLSWLADTEELISNQKPPSAEYKVVKAQIQEQKVSSVGGGPQDGQITFWGSSWDVHASSLVDLSSSHPSVMNALPKLNDPHRLNRRVPSLSRCLLKLAAGFAGQPCFSSPEFCFVPVVLLCQERAAGGSRAWFGCLDKGNVTKCESGPEVCPCLLR